MKKYILSTIVVITLMLSGYATNSGTEYDGNSYSQIKRYKTGWFNRNNVAQVDYDN